jgi:tRNA threonylcarbamoyladenosine modification (KEOPS) complex  Pcc1 subunit
MSVDAKAAIRLKFSSEKQLTTLLSALTPETHAMQTKRAKVNLKKDGCFLVLSVEADDTVALRATLNAYLRWIQSTIKVMAAVETKKPSLSNV